MSSDSWEWTLTDPAERAYERLQTHEQERIISKLDEIITDQWRDRVTTSNRSRARRIRNVESVRFDWVVSWITLNNCCGY